MKKAFIVGRRDFLPLVDTLDELLDSRELLHESDFSGLFNVQLKSIPPTKFKHFAVFRYGKGTLDNYKNLTNLNWGITDSLESVKMPAIKGMIALDLAIKYRQQHCFFSRIVGWNDSIENDTIYAHRITAALLSMDGFEELSRELSSMFEPKAQTNVMTRLMYANFVIRVVSAVEYMPEWVKLAAITNEYGYIPKRWEDYAHRLSKKQLAVDKQNRPDRNIIGEDLKNYLLRLEVEASKAISYIIAYNNLPESSVSLRKAWQHEGLDFFKTLPELKKYNLEQIDIMKQRLHEARQLLNIHFGVLMPPALAYPNQIYPNNIIADILAKRAYMFFSNAVTGLAQNFSFEFFDDPTFEKFIYKPPRSAPKNNIDYDIISMEANVLKSNAVTKKQIDNFNPKIFDFATTKQNLLCLYRDCNDNLTSAIKCLSFAHMRFAAYLEHNHNEYMLLLAAYVQQLIAPCIHNLIVLLRKAEDFSDGADNAPLLDREVIATSLNKQIDKVEALLPQNHQNMQGVGAFTQLATFDMLEPIRHEIQNLNDVSGSRLLHASQDIHHRNLL